jgi:phenylalanyl-tRNA synthetase beta chain
MLVTGQPLHAFDWDRVAGGRLEIRRAGAGEEVETLDGQVRRLDPDVVLIADADGPTSIAGVMGGARSEVSGATTRVLMEVATWDGPNINRTSAKLGLRSEASTRNEKGLQPEQAMEAQAVAARLMEVVCGVTPTGGTVDVGGPGPDGITIRLRATRLAGLLGTEIAASRVEAILTALGFGLAAVKDGWDATVPHWRRFDVTREADLIEEVARLDGVEKLPATLPPRTGVRGHLTPRQILRRRAADALTGRGLHEIAGWSFADRGLVDRLELAVGDPRRNVVAIRNPMSEEDAVLRTTLLGSLLDVARRGVARGAGALRLFEQGAIYLATPAGRLPRERHHLGGVLTGPVRPPSWREPAPPPIDFFAAKGILEALLATLRVDAAFTPAEEPFLHPGRSARVGELGWLGEVHPLVLERWELPRLVAFELDLDALEPAPAPQFRELVEFPAVRQDLALVLPAGVPADAVLAAVREAADTLESVEVFDLYTGAQVEEGRVSLALHLVFRAADRTLTEEDASAERARIVEHLQETVGGEVRA